MSQLAFDNVLKAIKQVGFPICVASALLYALWPAFEEQILVMRAARVGIEKNSETAAMNARSIEKLATCQESQSKTLNRVCRVLESMEKNGVKAVPPKPEVEGGPN